MDPFSPALLLKLALCVYGIGIVGSLLALRRERLANVLGFGSAINLLAGVCSGLLRPKERRNTGCVLQRAVAGDHAGIYGFERILFPDCVGTHGVDGLLSGQLRA